MGAGRGRREARHANWNRDAGVSCGGGYHAKSCADCTKLLLGGQPAGLQLCNGECRRVFGGHCVPPRTTFRGATRSRKTSLASTTRATGPAPRPHRLSARPAQERSAFRGEHALPHDAETVGAGGRGQARAPQRFAGSSRAWARRRRQGAVAAAAGAVAAAAGAVAAAAGAVAALDTPSLPSSQSSKSEASRGCREDAAAAEAHAAEDPHRVTGVCSRGVVGVQRAAVRWRRAGAVSLLRRERVSSADPRR